MRGLVVGKTAQAISNSVRDLVSQGVLGPGETLPPIRALAAELDVNRNTVAAAYRQLIATGAAHARGRAGTVISGPIELSDEPAAAHGLNDLASGNPDPNYLPDLRNTVAQMSYLAPLYGCPAIHPSLEVAAASLFDRPASGVLTVTHGAVDAVERVLASYLVRGDTVAVEHPCFLASIGTVQINGYRAAAVPMDEHGMTVDGLRRALSNGARAVIVTPRAHNPTGVSLTSRRAAGLRRVLQQYPEVLVVEDDHFSLLSSRSYHRVTPRTTPHWALIRSMTKSLGPDLRVALMVSDHTTAHSINARLRSGKTWVSHLLQSAAGHMLSDQNVMRLVQQARLIYADRISALTAELAAHGVKPFGEPDGLNAWIDLPVGCCPEAVRDELAKTGWAVQPGSLYAADGSASRTGIRVTTATLDPAAAERFAPALVDAIGSQI